MMVTDLEHLLGLPDDTPGPARRLAEHLGNIVRAASAGDADVAWESALPCRRRPARRRCPGRVIVLRTEPEAPIRWQCSVCDDDGVFSNWADSLYDLRPRRLTLASLGHEIVVSGQVAAALRELRLLDADSEHLVFRSRAHREGAALTVSGSDLEELIGFMAAEANHETDRGRQRQLDAAFAVLSDATQITDAW
jgi:hypothetical protein